MNIYSRENNLVLDNISDFNIADILECGQCFNYSRIAEQEYELVAYGKYLHVKQDNECVVLYNTNEEDYNKIWKTYFDMEKDYAVIKGRIIAADDRLTDAVHAKAGIRILQQDFFETLISFIISQNKQIPHIKQIVHTISERYGERIVLAPGKEVYTFPNVDKLYNVTEEELRECKVGFRAPYIRNAVEKVHNGDISGDMLRGMQVGEAREVLMTIKGVGEKVANCVLLFGLGFTDVFPVDVWMKRIMESMYFGEDTKRELIEQLAYDKFGEYSGYAQQYLFHFGRENGLGK